MRRILAAILITAGSTMGSAAADPTQGQPPDGIRLVASLGSATTPPEVTSAAKSYIDDCEGMEGSPQPSDLIVTEVNLSDDGEPDYIIDTAKLNSPCFCGSGGCAIEAWASDGDGYIKAFDSNVRGWQLIPKGTLPPVLIVDLHGTACGGVGVDLCLKALTYHEGKLIDTTAGQ